MLSPRVSERNRPLKGPCKCGAPFGLRCSVGDLLYVSVETFARRHGGAEKDLQWERRVSASRLIVVDNVVVFFVVFAGGPIKPVTVKRLHRRAAYSRPGNGVRARACARARVRGSMQMIELT